MTDSLASLDPAWPEVGGDRPSPTAEGDASVRLDGLLKPSEVARALGVSRSWLYQAAKEGRIPSLRLGGEDGPLRFVEADLRDWLHAARAAWRPGASTRDTLRRLADGQAG